VQFEGTVPTVADRVAQTVVKRILEPLVEPHFHDDSYGYRPNKSALDAVGRARQRCWRHPWVLDLDIKAFFDSIDSNLLMRAVRKHTDCAWVLLFIERWLKAPEQMEDGSLIARERGTPQGGVISPLLANLFLHYTFDLWMRRNHPDIPFERYADDGVPRTHRRKEVRNCVRDGGRSSGAGRQGQASNHRKLRRLKAGVVSVAEKAGLDPVRYGSERRARANR